MFTFIDSKRHKTIKLLTSDLVSFSRTLASGATLPLPNVLAKLHEMKTIIGGFRDPLRNTPLGMVITRPSNKSFFVGTVWEDWGDNGQHDEDLTLFTETASDHFEVERMKPDDIKKKFPLWDGYHHGDKSYLK